MSDCFEPSKIGRLKKAFLVQSKHDVVVEDYAQLWRR
jgi:hypothetical protein